MNYIGQYGEPRVHPYKMTDEQFRQWRNFEMARATDNLDFKARTILENIYLKMEWMFLRLNAELARNRYTLNMQGYYHD